MSSPVAFVPFISLVARVSHAGALCNEAPLGKDSPPPHRTVGAPAHRAFAGCRVAAARALASKPEIVFADEPTGNLDSRSGAEVLGFLRDSVRLLGRTVVMVTHDPVAASYAGRVVFLADGRIVDDMAAPTADRVLERMKGFDASRRTT